MDTTRGILFLVITLIIIVSIYYIVKMVKGRTPLSPSPSSSDQTGKISISDLKFERTLNPDKSNSKGDDGIVGYTIEYDNGIDYEELSKNVTFTLEWKNNIGFTDNVKGFMIEHHVKGVGNDNYKSEQSIDFYNTDTGDPIVYLSNFEENKVSIKGNGNYSVVGENRFKISVIMNDNDNTKTELYDGTAQDDKSHGIEISKDELGATLSMTKPETVTYTPVTQSFSSTSVKIKKVKYTIKNENSSLNYNGSGSIYLIPAFPKVIADGKVVDVDTFFFKYEVGENQYLLQDGAKGKWNEKTKRERGNVDFNNDEHDNRMFVSFYDKDTDTDNKVTAQLRYTKMGYGAGTHAITTDDNGKLELMSVSDTDTISETLFKNSVWTFTEVKGDPVNCIGGWVVDDYGTISGTKKETFRVTTPMENNGKECEASEGAIKETLVDVNCQGDWDPCKNAYGYAITCGSGTKKYIVTIPKQNDGKACPETHNATKTCWMGQCNTGGAGGVGGQ